MSFTSSSSFTHGICDRYRYKYVRQGELASRDSREMEVFGDFRLQRLADYMGERRRIFQHGTMCAAMLEVLRKEEVGPKIFSSALRRARG